MGWEARKHHKAGRGEGEADCGEGAQRVPTLWEDSYQGGLGAVPAQETVQEPGCGVKKAAWAWKPTLCTLEGKTMARGTGSWSEQLRQHQASSHPSTHTCVRASDGKCTPLTAWPGAPGCWGNKAGLWGPGGPDSSSSPRLTHGLGYLQGPDQCPGRWLE